MSSTNTTAPYLRIADAIAARIDGGELAPGDRVPSTRQLSHEHGVAIATATKVMAELRQRGLVHAVPGVGTVVAGTPGQGGAGSGIALGDRIAAGVGEGPRVAKCATQRTAGSPGRGIVRTAAGLAEADLSRAAIVRAAIQIADDEGMGALSMRRIAAELGAATMSLYRWVPSKDALVVEMLNTLMGTDEWPDPPPPGWRAQLEYLARRQWTGYRAHPWLASAVSLARPQLAPDAMMHTEWGMRALAGLGLDYTTMLYATLTLFGHVRGVGSSLESEVQAERDTGVNMDEWMQAQVAQFATIIGSGRYPMMAKMDSDPAVDFKLDQMFEFGLTVILDGLAHLIAEATSAPHRRGER